MKIADYLEQIPLLHTWDGGRTWDTGGFTKHQLGPMLDHFRKHAPARPAVLETGAGNSSIAFLLLEPSSLVTICPDDAVLRRIREYCAKHAIDLAPWVTYLDGSEWILPKLAELGRASAPSVDIALIDGCHNWPMVFVDFCYVHFLLRTGGFLVVDDLQLHTCKELGRLLAEGDEYERVLDLRKTAIYRKRTESRAMPEWNGEPYVVRRSNEYARAKDPFSLE